MWGKLFFKISKYMDSRSGRPSSNLSVGLAPASSPSRGASGEEGNFPECQGLPSVGEVALRSNDGEVILFFAKTPCKLPRDAV